MAKNTNKDNSKKMLISSTGNSEEGDILLERMRKRFRLANQAWDKQYKCMEEDIQFLSPNNQWPESIKVARSGKPTYAADRINAQVEQLANAQRDSRQGITIHPADSEADEKVAEVLQGLVRHIEEDSNADLAYDEASIWCIRTGLGFWRVLTQYEVNSFNQKIQIKSINNPMQVLIDPSFKEIDGSDIKWAFIIEIMTEDDFKDQYPDKKISTYGRQDWMNLSLRYPDWFSNNGKTVTVVEYFETQDKDITLCKLQDGRVVEKTEVKEEDIVVFERKDTKPEIKWYKLNGIEILEETIWPGNYVPIVPVFGKCLNEDGQRIYSGLVKNVKEEQCMFNIMKSTAIELIAGMPKAPWVGALGFMGSNKNKWAMINVTGETALEYVPVESSLGNPLPPPSRNVVEPPLQGILEVMNSIENDIKATNGMFDPSMGNKMANNQSGVAIENLQNQGSITNYHFSGNQNRAIRLGGKIIVDLIPQIYNEKQVINTLGIDGKNKMITINGEGFPNEIGIMDDDGVAQIFDVTKGKYRTTVDAEPSYQTQRLANKKILFDLAQKYPPLMQIAGDIVFGELDGPVGIELAERFEKALPPELQPQPKNPNSPEQLQKQLQQVMEQNQRLTQTLQQETQLADKVKQDQQTRLQIAQLENQTELVKHQSQLQHDSNKTLLQTEMEKIKLDNQNLQAETQKSHALILEVHKHLLAKNKASHAASLIPDESNQSGLL